MAVAMASSGCTFGICSSTSSKGFEKQPTISGGAALLRSFSTDPVQRLCIFPKTRYHIFISYMALYIYIYIIIDRYRYFIIAGFWFIGISLIRVTCHNLFSSMYCLITFFLKFWDSSLNLLAPLNLQCFLLICIVHD